MSAPERFSPTPDVLVAHLDGEAVLLHLGTKQYFRLNRTGAAIWKELEGGCEMAVVVERLVDTFDVAPSVAQAAAVEMVDELRRASLVRAD